MSLYDAMRVLKPRFFKIAPLVAGRGRRQRIVIGFDSEAERGQPFMFQFNMGQPIGTAANRAGSDGDERDTELVEIPDRIGAPLDAFTNWILKHCTSKTAEYIIVGWNLAYEWTQLFRDLPRELATEAEYHFIHRLIDGDGKQVARFNVQVFNQRRYSAIWTRLGAECIASCTPDNHKCGSKRRVRVIDGMAFYVTSLDKAGEMLGLGRKVAKPLHFTRKASTSDHFKEYARQDAYLTRRIGEQIVAMHDEFDVTQCISAPHFASKVYKRHFLEGEIRLPDIALEQAGLSSYHGGKNGYYLNGPKQLHNVYAYDITSAYPEAMRALPNPVLSTFDFTGNYRRQVHALWCVSGTLRACRYGALYDHNGTVRRGSTTVLNDVWITSYELDSMIEHGEIDITSIHGFVMRGPSGGSLANYVDRFFEMKRTSKGAARAAAKLFLNSLYGKFFQKQPIGRIGYMVIDGEEIGHIERDDAQQFDWQAGGLYHPPIASLITGFVRARIHGLEHKYEAIMTSTDGFFAMRPPDPADIGNDLGKLTVERGDLMIWRERLYSFSAPGGTGDKYALHGFRGSVEELRRVPLVPGSYSYKAQQMVTMRLSLHGLGIAKTRYAPGEFATLEYTLDLRAHAPP